MITILTTNTALACSYGENWSDDSFSAIHKRYGSRATELEVIDIKDRSFYFLGRDNGVRCPDFIRGMVEVNFTLDNLKACRSIIKFKTNDTFRIKKTICSLI